MKQFQKYEITIYLADEKQSMTIDKPSFIIGRSRKADVYIAHDLISREHLKVVFENDELFLEELGSINGSWLNGKKLPVKTLYACPSEVQVILGNKSGPSVLIQCCLEEEVLEITNSNLLIDIDQEEDTLVKKNPLINQPVFDVNVSKVSGDHYQSFDHIQSTKVVEQPQKIKIVEDTNPSINSGPNLILQMKNLLDLEAQTIELESKKEAEKTINHAQKIADEIIFRAKNQARELLLKSENDSENIKSKTNDAIEKLKLSNNIKINKLLAEAQKNSEDLLQSSTREANNIRSNAQKYSEEIIAKAKATSGQLAQEVEQSTQLKLEELKKIEDENNQKVNNINLVYQDLKTKVEALKNQEAESQLNYNHLTKNIETEQAGINIERANLENLKSELAISKKESDQRLIDLSFEERKVKAELETVLLEQKLQIAQVQAEVQQTKNLRDAVFLELNSLKNEKEQIEDLIKDAEQINIQKTKTLALLESQEEQAEAKLKNILQQQHNIQEEIETLKIKVIQTHERLKAEENEAREKTRRAQEFSTETDEKIKLKLLDFENQKIILTKEIETENKRIKNIQKEEIIKIEKQKEELENEFDQYRAKYKQAEELLIKKSQTNAIAIQQALKKNIQNLKTEANNQVNKLNVKFDQEILSLTKDHSNQKKHLQAEISKLELSRKNCEQESKKIDMALQEKIYKMDGKLRDFEESSKEKINQDLKKLEMDYQQQKISLERHKEKELNEIQEMKDKALKEIFGKKSERANAVTVNVEGHLLSELNKFRNKRMNDIFIENCTKEIRTLVYDTMMERVTSDKNKLNIAKTVALKNKDGGIRLKQILRKIFRISIILLFLFFSFTTYQKVKNTSEFLSTKIYLEKNLKQYINEYLN